MACRDTVSQKSESGGPSSQKKEFVFQGSGGEISKNPDTHPVTLLLYSNPHLPTMLNAPYRPFGEHRCEKNERQRKKQKKSPILNFCTCMNQNTRIIRRSSNTADISQLRTIPQSTEKALFPFSFETSKG
jgi:hypothetical protein